MPLDVKEEVSKLRQMYKDDPKQDSFNLLLLGESGSGKTFLLRTARKPVHIDSFDPGGTKSLRDLIISGDVIPDTSFENDDPFNPKVFEQWKAKFEDRKRNGYFDAMGTYVIDSATTWSDAIMNYILRKAGHAGEAPRWAHDYVPQKVEIRNALAKCLDLPCDFVLTGHLKLVEDPTEGYIFRFMTTGQGMVTIPLMFDEIWTTVANTKGSGTEYKLLIESQGIRLARSRIAGGKKELKGNQEPDIKRILKLAGLPSEDKPKI